MKSSSRNGARVRLLALHTTEGIRKNSDLLAFFNRSTAKGSSHASADTSGLMEQGFVPYDRAAWTLRNGNSISDNLEQCGFAAWSRAEWLGPQMGTIRAAALWVARRSVARGIPIRTITHSELRAGAAGVIQHNDWTVAMRDGSHWDCGPNYPIDVVIDLARQHAGGPGTPTPGLGDTHRVQPGETLWGISRRYSTTVDDIRRWNSITTDLLSVGQILRIKPPPPPPLPAPTRPILSEGMMDNPQVLSIQKWANRWFPSYSSTPLIEDGDFGPGTKRFIREFQQRVNILDDGVVGPATYAKMFQNGYK